MAGVARKPVILMASFLSQPSPQIVKLRRIRHTKKLLDLSGSKRGSSYSNSTV
jgi:hypothetical protein